MAQAPAVEVEVVLMRGEHVWALSGAQVDELVGKPVTIGERSVGEVLAAWRGNGVLYARLSVPVAIVGLCEPPPEHSLSIGPSSQG
jgi:hypothetical protein